MLNDMMRKLRTIVDRAGLRRGHPILLAIRIPDSREYSRLVGVDYEQWLKEDLVDILEVNDYIKLEPWNVRPSCFKPRIWDDKEDVRIAGYECTIPAGKTVTLTTTLSPEKLEQQ